MTPKDYYKRIEALPSPVLPGGSFRPITYTVIRYDRGSTVKYYSCSYDTVFEQISYGFVNLSVEVPKYQDYAVRKLLRKNNYSVFTLNL